MLSKKSKKMITRFLSPLAVLLIISGGIASIYYYENVMRGEFTVRYNSIINKPQEPILIHLDNETWQYEAAVCYIPICSRGRMSWKEMNALFITDTAEMPWAVAKYPSIRMINMNEQGDGKVAASVQIARNYWIKIETAVVVNSYEMALLCSPVASYLNAPILYYGEITKKFLEEKGVENVIIGGDFNMEDFRAKILKEQKDVHKFYLEIIKEKINYIVVLNPNDIYSGRIRGLSLSGAMLASERHALIVSENYSVDINYCYAIGYGTGDAGSGERGDDDDNLTDDEEMEIQRSINFRVIECLKDIRECVKLMNEKEMNATYVALVGDIDSVPMMYVKSPIWIAHEGEEGNWGEEYIATDMYYGDLEIEFKDENLTSVNYYAGDDRLYTQEIYVGRIVARNLLDATALVVRSVGYWKYEYVREFESRLALIITSYVIGMGHVVPPAEQEIVFIKNGMIANRLQGGKAGKYAPDEIPYTNAVIYDGHGYPDGWYVTWVSDKDDATDADRIGTEDVENIKIRPIVLFGGACLSSSLDWPKIWRENVSIERYFSLAVLHAGAMGYIGATEESWGDFVTGGGDFGLATLYWDKYLTDKMSIGGALAKAKEEFYFKDWKNEYGQVCALENVLYGDPAGVFYHPGREVPN